MQQLRLGDPADPATDIGPLIDPAALARLRAHLSDMTTGAGRLWYQCELPEELATVGGYFFGPALVELDSPSVTSINALLTAHRRATLRAR